MAFALLQDLLALLKELPSPVCCTLGIACACASAASTVVGMLLQKEGLARENKFIYYLGLLIFIFVKPGGQIVALFFAPVSLVAPFASVAILLNAVIVPWCRAEKLSRQHAVNGALLTAGCVGCIAMGPHDARMWSFPQICDLAAKSQAATLVLSSVTVVLACKLKLSHRAYGEQQSSPTKKRCDNPGFGVVVAAFVPSAASALNNVIIKSLLQGLVSGPSLLLLPWAGALVGTAFLQVWSTTIGVQLFDMLVYVPVQVSEQILLTVAYGATFFEESPANPVVFFLCTIAIAFGVLMLQPKPTEDDTGYHIIEDGGDEQKQNSKNLAENFMTPTCSDSIIGA